ncbi:MAG: hypothetical protein ACAH88_19290 [Roseimicrobium sp.]
MSTSTERHTQAELLTQQQTMEKMNLSAQQLARLRASRKMAYHKRCGRVYYALEEVERVMQAFEVPALHAVVEPLTLKLAKEAR